MVAATATKTIAYRSITRFIGPISNGGGRRFLPRSRPPTILERGLDHLRRSEIAGAPALPQPVGDLLFGLRRAGRAGLELDVAAHDPKPHCGEPAQSSAVELAHVDRLVCGAGFV